MRNSEEHAVLVNSRTYRNGCQTLDLDGPQFELRL